MRETLMIKLYDWSSKVYAQTFKRHIQAWNITKEEFLEFPEGSLGKELGLFYQSKGFDVIPKLENHDVFHLLTDTDTHVQDEIAMQYVLLGNGKISFYLVGVICLGTLVFPEYWKLYYKSSIKGSKMNRFFDVDFKVLLSTSLFELKKSFHIKNILVIINN